MSEVHWFPDMSDEEDRVDGFPYQAFLQIDSGCFPLPIWFATVGDCEEFIARIPAGAAGTSTGTPDTKGEKE